MKHALEASAHTIFVHAGRFISFYGYKVRSECGGDVAKVTAYFSACADESEIRVNGRKILAGETSSPSIPVRLSDGVTPDPIQVVNVSSSGETKTYTIAFQSTRGTKILSVEERIEVTRKIPALHHVSRLWREHEGGETNVSHMYQLVANELSVKTFKEKQVIATNGDGCTFYIIEEGEARVISDCRPSEGGP